MVISPRRILWPTDFSPLALHGARYARAFRDLFSAELHVIHVLPPPFAPDLSVTLPTEMPLAYADHELVNACRTRLEQVVIGQFGGQEGTVQWVSIGNPWSTICRYAQTAEIDLVVVSTHGRTGLQHVLIGSTAERIVQHAPCPVLVVKSPQKEFIAE